jgi:hypothetical protein
MMTDIQDIQNFGHSLVTILARFSAKGQPCFSCLQVAE